MNYIAMTEDYMVNAAAETREAAEQSASVKNTSKGYKTQRALEDEGSVEALTPYKDDKIAQTVRRDFAIKNLPPHHPTDRCPCPW